MQQTGIKEYENGKPLREQIVWNRPWYTAAQKALHARGLKYRAGEMPHKQPDLISLHDRSVTVTCLLRNAVQRSQATDFVRLQICTHLHTFDEPILCSAAQFGSGSTVRRCFREEALWQNGRRDVVNILGRYAASKEGFALRSHIRYRSCVAYLRA